LFFCLACLLIFSFDFIFVLFPLTDDTEGAKRMSRRESNKKAAQKSGARLSRPERRHDDLSQSYTFDPSPNVSSTPFGAQHNQSNKEEKTKSSRQDWCGPFAVANQMLARRAEAKAAREEALKAKKGDDNGDHSSADDEEIDFSKANTPHPLDNIIDLHKKEKRERQWPSLMFTPGFREQIRQQTTTYGLLSERLEFSQAVNKSVPSLSSTIIKFLTDNFENVAGIGDVSTDDRTKILDSLVERGKMNDENFTKIFAPSLLQGDSADGDDDGGGGDDDDYYSTNIDEIVVPDASFLSEKALRDVLVFLMKNGCRSIQLRYAAEFTNQTVNEIASNLSPLSLLELSGAYKLGDAECASLLDFSSKTLHTCRFDACPLVFTSTIKSIINLSSLHTLTITNCEKISPDILRTLKPALKGLISLDLSSHINLTDELFCHLIGDNDGNLQHINISDTGVSDKSLLAIRCLNTKGSLQSLLCADVRRITADGVEAFFDEAMEEEEGTSSIPPPPRLKTIAFTVASDLSVERMCSVADPFHTSYGLISVSLRNCGMTDRSLEYIAARCSKSLTVLDVSYSHEITNRGLGYLCKTVGEQFKKLSIWGCGQVTWEFWASTAAEGKGRIEIDGIWMKKTNVNPFVNGRKEKRARMDEADSGNNIDN